MTSLRIDPDMSAKVWAKRLGVFIDSARDDGVNFFLSKDTCQISVSKDGKVYTSDGEDVSDEF